jgi:anaerobic selenocysteine-containing dehydrogenase
MNPKNIPAYCAQCQSSCPILCTVKNERLIRIRPDNKHPNASPLCPKGLAGTELVYHPLRLKHPMIRTRPKGDDNPGWERISWQKAFQVITEKLQRIKKQHGAQAVVFNRPGPGGSPAKDYAAWVVRLAYAFGSPNTLATGHVCQWHRDTGSKYTYGRQAWPEPDYAHTKLVMVWGHNPYASVRCNVRDISNAVKQGAKLIVIDPRRTKLAEKADVWLQIRPGSDSALLLSLIHVLIKTDSYDAHFLKNWTNAPFLIDADTGDLLRFPDDPTDEKTAHFMVWDKNSHQPCRYDPVTGNYENSSVDPDLFKEVEITRFEGKSIKARPVFAHLKEIAQRFKAENASVITGIPAKQIRAAAEMISQNSPYCYYSYNGLEQHTNATQTNRALCILYAMSGHLDQQGGNVFFPSIPGTKVRDARMLPADMHALRIGHNRRPLGPAGFPNSSVQAYEVFETLLSEKPYPIKALIAFGGNIITANANSLTGRDALKKLDFFVQTELFMTPAAELADIVLPAATFYESPAFKTGFPNLRSARERIQYRPPIIPPLHEAKPDMQIIFELSKHLNLSKHFWNGSMEAAFSDLAKACGVTLETLQQHPRGISIPLNISYKKYEAYNPNTEAIPGFKTPSKRVEIFSQQFKDHGYDPLPIFQEPVVSPVSRPDLKDQFPLILTCNKLLQFCHGQHRAIPSLRKAVPHPFVEMNPIIADELKIEDKEWVIVETHHGQIRCQAHLTDKILKNVVCIQHGWWQPCPELGLPGYDPYASQGANANLLFATDAIDPISGSVPYKAYICNIKKISASAEETS